MTDITTTFAEGAIADTLVTYVTTFDVDADATASEAWSYSFVAGGQGLVGSALASTQVSVQMHWQVSVEASATASTRASVALPMAVTASAGASETVDAIIGTMTVAQATAGDAVEAFVTYNVDVAASAVASVGSISQAAMMAVAEATATDAVSFSYAASSDIVEKALATELWDAILTFNPSVTTGALATTSVTPNLAYNVLVEEGACADAEASTSGSSTAWAINTRTNAVTQYRNFNFNSFATMGRKYIAADANGIYELNGPQDDTAPVIGDFGGGQFQPAQGKLAGFKGVYIGARTYGGYWQTTLDAGDGRSYIYNTLANPNLMTTKVTVGKGLRSTYFGWRLTAIDGQDFDFDKIEFVPSVSGRRVDG